MLTRVGADAAPVARIVVHVALTPLGDAVPDGPGVADDTPSQTRPVVLGLARNPVSHTLVGTVFRPVAGDDQTLSPASALPGAMSRAAMAKNRAVIPLYVRLYMILFPFFLMVRTFTRPRTQQPS